MMDNYSLKSKIVFFNILSIFFITTAVFVLTYFDLKSHLFEKAIEEQKARIDVLDQFIKSRAKDGARYHIKDGNLYIGDHKINGDMTEVDYFSAFFGSTATVFQEQTRIATSVKKNGKRLTGTQLGAGKVYDKVFREKKSYHGIGNIGGVNYLTSYRPIIGDRGKVIGILYTGIKESEFMDVLTTLLIKMFLQIIVIAGFVVFGVSYYIQKYLQPVKDIENNLLSAVDKVKQMSQELSAVAENAKAAAGSTSDSATTVASGSEETSSQVSSVASATEELSGSIQQISGHMVTLSQQHVATATANSRTAEDKTQQLVSSAEKIGQVVELITNIADQTNLLALNASIEAARAGEAGAGFAVVADEVKKLATETAKATQSIADLVKEIQTGTTEAAEAMHRIEESLKDVEEVSSSIVSAIDEQGVATADISESLQQAALGTEQIARSVSSIMDASQNTENESERVQSLVSELSNQGEQLQHAWQELNDLTVGKK